MTAQRRFLFLQGPHGPFFAGLARALTRSGAACWRAGFNRGDEAFWFDRSTYIPVPEGLDGWPDRLAAILAEHAITDLVLYGDTRPVHAQAARVARDWGLTLHVFEEGYLRPHWITYERGGANGHSRLMEFTLDDMRRMLADGAIDRAEAPARWGDMRQHVLYGALYHAFVLFGNRRYPGYVPHRSPGVAQEFRLHLRRLLAMPFHRAERAIATTRIRRGSYPYHVVLLQLEHDASFRHHSPFPDMGAFLGTVVSAFAAGAPRHHHLVFKAHPLEDGRVPLRREIDRLSREHGLAGRVHFVRGGKLARLLDTAESAVTVNSTAAQQALWRGLPLKALGRAVYSQPEFVSDQPLRDFFAAPRRPDRAAYLAYRQFLLETSQVPGGFYSARGRRRLYRGLVDRMLASCDGYDALAAPDATRRQHLRALP